MENLNMMSLEGKNNVYQADFDKLYKYYIRPNEEEFRWQYLKNCQGWNGVEYQDCIFDFMSVADGEYLIVDKENKKICGTLNAKAFQWAQRVEKTISSILIADQWDIREMLSVIQQKKWSQVYIVLNQAARKFSSFLKLKEFMSMLPGDIRIFTTTEDMRWYFMSHHGAYLPRKVVAPEPKQYLEFFKTIHDKRIQNRFPSDNVFLSICLPTYNRGELALKSTKIALTSDFDAEIEFVVCDNGSTVGVQSYREIENIKDSRLRYYRSAQNGGYSYNILNCLQRAKGKFVLFISDEDSVVPEEMETALNWLSNHMEDAGACIFNGSETKGWVAVHKEKVFEPGMDAVLRAFNMNYITGCCFNMERVKEVNLFQYAVEVGDNYYFKVYTHCALSARLAVRYKIIDSDIVLWHFGEERARNDDWGGDGIIRTSELPESRTLQSADAVRLVKDSLAEQDLFEIFSNRMAVYYELLSLLYKLPGYSDEFKNKYSWIDVCVLHYETCRQLIQELDVKDRSPFITKMNKIAFNWLVCKRRQRLCTPEENLLSSMQAQVAKYYFDKGTPFGEIDFEGIEEELRDWMEEFLGKGVDLQL